MTRRTGTSSMQLLFLKFLLWMHGKTPWLWNTGQLDGDNLPLKICVVFAVGASSQKETPHPSTMRETSSNLLTAGEGEYLTHVGVVVLKETGADLQD